MIRMSVLLGKDSIVSMRNIVENLVFLWPSNDGQFVLNPSGISDDSHEDI